jgi:hypothetical protein
MTNPAMSDDNLGRIAWLYDEPEEGAPTPWEDLDHAERCRYIEMARAVAYEVRRERDAVNAELLKIARAIVRDAEVRPGAYIHNGDLITRLGGAVKAAERVREAK